MNHEQFIEKHVREELIRLGFPVPVAQGGRSRPCIYTGACLRQAARGKFSMMFYDTRSCGRRNKQPQPTGSKKSALSAPNSAGCSERVKTDVRQHFGLRVQSRHAITRRVCQTLLK